jgi:hypothetical protein
MVVDHQIISFDCCSGATMSTSIGVVTLLGATFVSVLGHRLPTQSFIGDWENGRWGDGKFPGVSAVAAVATLRLGATIAADAATRNALTEAADKLSATLASQIESFARALNSASG